MASIQTGQVFVPCLSDENPMPNFMRVETLSIRISKVERAALRVAARRNKISQSQLVRNALQAYGVAPANQAAPNAYDLVKSLIGKYKDGPGDLSTAPRHMKGFGR